MKLGLYDVSEYPSCYYDYDEEGFLRCFDEEYYPQKFISRDIEWRYCVIGNIVPEHTDEEDILRFGTKVFPGGRKVYISKSFWPNDGTVTVAGLTRFKNKYDTEHVSLDLIENIRVSKTYAAGPLMIMTNFEFSYTWWGNTNREKKRCKEFAAALNEYKVLKQSNPDLFISAEAT